MKKIIYNWSDFIGDTVNLANKLKNYKGLTFKDVYGISRGGLIPTVIISHLLDIPFVRYENKINSKTLIIDDISDSGKTLKKLLKKHKTGMTATLWIMKETKYIPDIHIKIKNKDEWIIFPWEMSAKDYKNL